MAKSASLAFAICSWLFAVSLGLWQLSLGLHRFWSRSFCRCSFRASFCRVFCILCFNLRVLQFAFGQLRVSNFSLAQVVSASFVRSFFGTSCGCSISLQGKSTEAIVLASKTVAGCHLTRRSTRPSSVIAFPSRTTRRVNLGVRRHRAIIFVGRVAKFVAHCSFAASFLALNVLPWPALLCCWRCSRSSSIARAGACRTLARIGAREVFQLSACWQAVWFSRRRLGRRRTVAGFSPARYRSGMRSRALLPSNYSFNATVMGRCDNPAPCAAR